MTTTEQFDAQLQDAIKRGYRISFNNVRLVIDDGRSVIFVLPMHTEITTDMLEACDKARSTWATKGTS